MTHALVILCGGPSTRMGSDKALLPFGDNCLIEYLVHKFRPCFSRIYLSVRRKGNYAYLESSCHGNPRYLSECRTDVGRLFLPFHD